MLIENVALRRIKVENIDNEIYNIDKEILVSELVLKHLSSFLPPPNDCSKLPTGTIININTNIAPTGFIACDGERHPSKLYPRLASFLNENPKKRFFNTPIPWRVFTV